MSGEAVSQARLRWRQLSATLLATCLLVTSCGGGGGGQSQAGVGSGGTGSYTSGPITGFGSIIVNGVEYNYTAAAVRSADGDAPTTLKLGMTVDVEGSAIANSLATAQTVTYGSEILGPVQGTPTSSTTLTVLGQTVTVNSKTVFDGFSALSDLVSGTVVEVYGVNYGASGITATRIEKRASPPGEYRLRGIATVSSATSFHIGAANISYLLSDPPAPRSGAMVRVSLSATPACATGTVCEATKLQAGTRQIVTSEDAHLEGAITSKIGTQVVVNGVAVETSGASVEGNATLTIGLRVEVNGRVTNGVLYASTISIESDSEKEAEDSEIKGCVGNLTASSFVVQGQRVSYQGVTPHDGVLANGVQVEVHGKGYVNDAQGSLLQAEEVEVKPGTGSCPP